MSKYWAITIVSPGPPAYSDTGYSDTLATVTVLAITKPILPVTKTLCLQ